MTPGFRRALIGLPIYLLVVYGLIKGGLIIGSDVEVGGAVAIIIGLHLVAGALIASLWALALPTLLAIVFVPFAGGPGSDDWSMVWLAYFVLPGAVITRIGVGLGQWLRDRDRQA